MKGKSETGDKLKLGLQRKQGTRSAVRWIPVGEALPDDDLSVLVATMSGAVEKGYLDAGDWRWASAGLVDEVVTHWAELPDHPTLGDKLKLELQPGDTLKREIQQDGLNNEVTK